MHTIDECPRCGKDFMYHHTDSHLHRVVAWDADTKEPCSSEVICQDCDLDDKLKEYPIQDDTWKSRRWNADKTDYIDLSD